MSRRMTTSEAINEARRCLNCARPLCRTGCPIENNIPQFIRALSEGNIGLAYEIISERSNCPPFAAGYARMNASVKRTAWPKTNTVLKSAVWKCSLPILPTKTI